MLDTWTNWAGTVTAKPASVHHPQDLAEAADALTTAERHGLPVRARSAAATRSAPSPHPRASLSTCRHSAESNTPTRTPAW